MSTTNQPSQSVDNGRARKVLQETAENLAFGARDCAHDCTKHYVTEPAKDLFTLAKDYAKEKPEVATAWAFMLGVVVGWKIKPW